MSVTRATDHSAALAALVGKPLDGHVYETLDRYVDLLLGAGVERGLIGPREADRVWERHILNCAALAPLLPAGASVGDIGSGAGLPGVVLAILRPDLHVTLVEPLLRRADFLTEVRAELGLDSALGVDRVRAEDYSGPAMDVVVARAVAPLDRLAGWCLPLVRPGGMVLAMKGSRASAEVAEHRSAVLRSGARSVEIEVVGAEVLSEPTTVVVLRKR